MQKLAREFNFPETTFVLPPRSPAHTCQVRIFTPRQELPFAGHPTIGTAAVVARLGRGNAARQFVFEEGIGPITVAIDGQAIRLRIRSPDYETTQEAPPITAIARALALPEDAIVESFYAGIGLRFCFVRLTDREMVDRAVLDKAAWAAGIADSWSPRLYVFARDPRDGARLHARFFAPGFGIEEDPATGSACASLVASLAQRSPDPDGSYEVQIDQGVIMGPPEFAGGHRLSGERATHRDCRQRARHHHRQRHNAIATE